MPFSSINFTDSVETRTRLKKWGFIFKRRYLSKFRILLV